MSNDPAVHERQETQDHASSIIKQLSNVIYRSGLILLEGNLILTKSEINFISSRPVGNQRLDNSHGGEDAQLKTRNDPETDAQDMYAKGNSTAVITIQLSSIESMTFETALGMPSLQVKWQDVSKAFGRTRKSQFIQKGAVSRDERIVTLIALIDEARNSESASRQQQPNQLEQEIPDSPDSGLLRSEIMDVLDKKEWKGIFQIVTELRDKFNLKYDIDQVESVLEKLVREKLAEEDSVGGFFRKT